MSAHDEQTQHEAAASPYISAYLSRKQAEALEQHLTALPQKKWLPVMKAIRQALERNAGDKRYPWQERQP